MYNPAAIMRERSLRLTHNKLDVRFLSKFLDTNITTMSFLSQMYVSDTSLFCLGPDLFSQALYSCAWRSLQYSFAPSSGKVAKVAYGYLYMPHLLLLNSNSPIAGLRPVLTQPENVGISPRILLLMYNSDGLRSRNQHVRDKM